MTWARTDRSFDVVVYGATGFVGRLVAEHLARRPAQVRVALAGRSAERLRSVRASLGRVAVGWEVLVADSDDAAALADLARSTAVVATTVGPYTRHGMALARACAEAGTHYADLCGEVLFLRRTAAELHDVARDSGARIVHACGFDSVPSDLGVLLTAERARADGAGQLRETTLTVREAVGGVSGGTVDSIRLQVDAAREPDTRRILADPYALSPNRGAEPGVDQGAPSRAFLDVMTGTWAAPFPMAGVNTRVVHRSNALQGWAYGRSFRYREVVDCGTGPAGRRRARVLAAGIEAGVAALALPPTRRLADRLLPEPGEGPDAQTRRDGRFRMEVLARTTSGARYRTVVAAQGDPGYSATAVMIGEAAVALALDGPQLRGEPGVLTPATGVGAVLADRLVQAGFEISTERVGDGAG